MIEQLGTNASGVFTCEGISQNRGLGTVSQSVPRSVSSSVTASSPLSSAGPSASGSTNSMDSSRSAHTSNGPVLKHTGKHCVTLNQQIAPTFS